MPAPARTSHPSSLPARSTTEKSFVNWPGPDVASAEIIVKKGGLPEVGEVLGGRYRIEARLDDRDDSGAFQACRIDDGARFVIKVLGLRRSQVRREQEVRFSATSEVLSKLRHPRISEIRDYGETEGDRLYVVSEALEGETLQERLERAGPMPWSELGSLAVQICDVLDAAHRRGLTHRDLRPANVFMEAGTGEVKVLNFGLADLASRHRLLLLTATETIRGTSEYLAPEDWRGLEIDHRVDVYALGVSLYLLLSGTMPTEYDQTRVTIPGAPYRSLPAAIPEEVARIVYRCLATKPEERFPDMRALSRAILDTLPAAELSEAARRARARMNGRARTAWLRRVPSERLQQVLVIAAAVGVLIAAS